LSTDTARTAFRKAEEQRIGNIRGTIITLCQFLTISAANRVSFQRVVNFRIVNLKDSVAVGVRCEWEEDHPPVLLLHVPQPFSLVVQDSSECVVMVSPFRTSFHPRIPLDSNCFPNRFGPSGESPDSRHLWVLAMMAATSSIN
jgi:hypothetical protein